MIIAVTSDDTRMLLGLKDGRILVHDTSILFTPGTDDIPPLHSWPSSPYVPQQILPNPGDIPNLIAILLPPGAPQSVVVLDVQKHESFAGWERDDTSDPVTTSVSL
jgi:nucleoporin NUP159